MAPQRTIQSLFGEFCIELSASPYITALAGILPSMTVAGAVLEPPYDVATALCGEGVVRHSTTSRHGSRSVHKELGSDSIVFNDESWREQLDIVGTQIQSVLSPQSDIVQTEFCRCLMYRGCEWVCTPKDAPRRPDVFGTLLFVLPMKDSDVQVSLRSAHAADAAVVSTHREECRWVAFYSGVRCAVRRGHEGYLLLLSYNLVRRGHRPIEVHPSPAARALFAAISALLHANWRKKRWNGVSFRLQFTYPPGPVTPDQLNGADARFYQTAVQQREFDVSLHYTIRDREDPEDDGVDHFLFLTLSSPAGGLAKEWACPGGPPKGRVGTLFTKLHKDNLFRRLSLDSALDRRQGVPGPRHTGSPKTRPGVGRGDRPPSVSAAPTADSGAPGPFLTRLQKTCASPNLRMMQRRATQ